MTARKATKNLDWNAWLTVHYGRVPGEPWNKGKDFVFSGPCGADRRLLLYAICPPEYALSSGQPSRIKELEARGYDTTTLEFRVKRKVQP